MIALYILYALLGISILIFVHELGHFLAAKRVGVRVERFAIGFDPPVRGRNLRLLCFRRGDTEYVLGAVPFGGYVKLAGGEMMLETDRKPAPDELPGKSVGARSFVFAAGSAMNILFAFLFFMAAFTLGVPFPEPQFDVVEPGTPAWESGLKPGDKVLEIDGEEPMDFSEVKLAVALGSPSKSIDLKIARHASSGATETLDFAVTPRWNSDSGFNIIGVMPAYSDVIAELDPKSLAARSGIQTGDRLLALELGGTRLARLPVTLLMNALAEYTLTHPQESYKVLVSRTGGEQWIAINPNSKDTEKPSPQLGVLQGQGSVLRAIQPGSDALKLLRVNDRWTGIAGSPIASAHWLRILERSPDPSGRIDLNFTSPDGSERSVTVDRDTFLAWNITGELFWDYPAAVVGEVKSNTPFEHAGLKVGDTVTHLGAAALFSPDDIADLLTRDSAAMMTVSVSREGATIALKISRADLIAAEGVTWQSMPPLGAVIPGSPAEKAGVTPGSTILRIGQKRVYSWKEMVDALRGSVVGSKVEIAWRDPTGAEKKAEAALSLEPAVALGAPVEPLQKTVRVSAIESFRAGAKRTVLAAKQLFLTLRSLIRREVSPKNLSGPVGITHLLTKVAEQNSLSTLIYYLALISINLGLFNLLPFPILDGGHLLFLAIEKVKGSPVSVKIQEWAMNVAFLLILFLAVFVTFNDLKRLLP